MKVRKAVIVAAGWGTRFLPATKAVPKEMLPLFDRPAIDFAVEEALTSGMEEVIIITASGKEAIAANYAPAPALEAFLEARGDDERLRLVTGAGGGARFTYVIQEQQLGLGHAVLTARSAVGDEPFAVILPDDIIVGERPGLSQMLDVYQEFGGGVVALEKVPGEDISRYGAITPEAVRQGIYRILDLVEKPSLAQAPSDLGVVGRYILEPGIFDIIEATTPGKGGEIQLTDALKAWCAQRPLYGLEFTGTRYDTGNPLGLLTASLSVALARPDTAPELRQYLQKLLR